jgi:hypothetical protein
LLHLAKYAQFCFTSLAGLKINTPPTLLLLARRAAVNIGRLTACEFTALKAVIKRARLAKSVRSPKSKKDLDSRILMLDEILRRDKLLLRDKKVFNFKRGDK